MGHRIELGEIEGVVSNIEGVEIAACVYDEAADRIVLIYKGTARPASVNASLKNTLPRYMLPGKTEKVEEMPFTPGGKIDRKGLKERYTTAN